MKKLTLFPLTTLLLANFAQSQGCIFKVIVNAVPDGCPNRFREGNTVTTVLSCVDTISKVELKAGNA